MTTLRFDAHKNLFIDQSRFYLIYVLFIRYLLSEIVIFEALSLKSYTV